jgi:hypothetical protein
MTALEDGEFLMLKRAEDYPDTPRPRGPVSALRVAEPPREHWRRHVEGDTVIRVSAATAVLGVAAIAAVVSYSHIYDLAVGHAETGTAARLLPVSVDGLIMSASLALLHAARKRLRAPWMAYLMLSFGVGATIAANMAYGLPAGWMAAAIAAWPATAFVGSVEMALMLARNERRAEDGGTENRHQRQWWRRRNDRHAAPLPAPPSAPVAVPETAIAAVPPTVVATPAGGPAKPPPVSAAALSAVPSRTPPNRQPRPRQVPRRTAKRDTSAAAKSARADEELTANPNRTNAEIATASGASERTVERRRAARKALETSRT